MINVQSLNKLFNSDFMADEILQCEVDNRLVCNNSLFIAFVGNRYNPVEHLSELEKKGVKYILCQKSDLSDEQQLKWKEKFSFFVCEDIQKAVADIAKIICDEFKARGGKLIGISGSNGKTTTKEMLYHLLSETYGEDTVICTQKNNNNHLGVPFTVFQINKNTKYAIVELGSNAPGEIEFLCKIISPNLGLTTNIGDTHLEFFGSRENVFVEESILHKYCEEVFLKNEDDILLQKMDGELIKSFGEKGNDFRFELTNEEVVVNNIKINNSHIMGKHNFINLACAYIIASEVGVQSDHAKIIKACETFKPTFNRSQWLKVGSSNIFLDAYNANPTSVEAAVVGFADYLNRNRISFETACLILGDMNELGDNAKVLHENTGKKIASLNFGHYVYIGRFCEDYCQTSEAKSSKYKTTEEALLHLKDLIKKYEYLMIKGSRSLQLERITDIK